MYHGMFSPLPFSLFWKLTQCKPMGIFTLSQVLGLGGSGRIYLKSFYEEKDLISICHTITTGHLEPENFTFTRSNCCSVEIGIAHLFLLAFKNFSALSILALNFWLSLSQRKISFPYFPDTHMDKNSTTDHSVFFLLALLSVPIPGTL